MAKLVNIRKAKALLYAGQVITKRGQKFYHGKPRNEVKGRSLRDEAQRFRQQANELESQSAGGE